LHEGKDCLLEELVHTKFCPENLFPKELTNGVEKKKKKRKKKRERKKSSLLNLLGFSYLSF